MFGGLETSLQELNCLKEYDIHKASISLPCGTTCIRCHTSTTSTGCVLRQIFPSSQVALPCLRRVLGRKAHVFYHQKLGFVIRCWYQNVTFPPKDILCKVTMLPRKEVLLCFCLFLKMFIFFSGFFHRLFAFWQVVCYLAHKEQEFLDEAPGFLTMVSS